MIAASSPTLHPSTQSLSKISAAYLLEVTTAPCIYGEEERKEISALVGIHNRFVSGTNWRDIAEDLASIEILFSGWGGPRLDREFLDAAPHLKAVFYGAGSVKGIVTEEFWKRDILLCSAASANAIPVAEFTISQIYALLKDVYRYAREVRARRDWVAHWPVVGGFRSTIGLVSMGKIGRLVAEKLQDSDLKVLAFDPFMKADEFAALGVTPVTLEELFVRSDVISVHTPLLPETIGMINRDLLFSMKQSAALINTARGAVIDQIALTEVLTERPDLFALLDVAWPQPPPVDSHLYDLPNIIITPHIAGSMNDECQRMGRMMVDELHRYLDGQPLLHRVHKERISRLA